MKAAPTTRRGPILLAVAAVSAVALGAWWLWPVAPPAAGGGDSARPVTPVIIYLIDTLRADRLGLYGYGAPTSPNIDALAADSVVFDHAYGAAPWTLPSVASLLTSTFACEHGVVRYRQHLSPAVRTLAERLGQEGYATAAYYSNIHAGAVANLNRGYDIAEERKSSENDRAADVSAFLGQHGSGPFYLYLHTMEPHEPFAVPARFMSRFGHVSVEDRENFRAIWFKFNELKSADWSAGRPIGSTDNTAVQQEVFRYLASHRDQLSLLYDAAVTYADDNLGQVIDVLKRQGVWDRAIFVLVADHGEELGDHGGWFHDQSVYEELVHVPMIVHFPRGEFGGRRIGAAVSLVDVMPTLLDYLGRPDLCEGCRGSSLLPLLSDGGTPGRQPAGADYVPALRINEIMYFRPFKDGRGDRNIVLRRDQWKGIWNADPGKVELYDLAADPAERSDVSGSHPEIASAMQAFAADWYRSCGASASAPTEVDKLDERTRERLRAMGYFN